MGYYFCFGFIDIMFVIVFVLVPGYGLFVFGVYVLVR